MKLKVETVIGQDKIKEIVGKLTKEEISKGEAIRELFNGGLAVKEIAAATNIRYNHVYNVVRNEVLTKGLEVEQTGRNSENSKKTQIIALLGEGKTITQISQELKVLYNYVWQIAKAAGYTKKKEKENAPAVATTEQPVEQPEAKHTHAHKKNDKAVA